MSEDNIIAMLTAETLRPADSAGFPDTDAIFQRRRELSKLPLHAIDGEFLTSNIARFHLNGATIDMPVTFGVAQFLEGFGGVVSRRDDEAFFAAITTLLGDGYSAVYVVRGSEGNPWMVLWDAERDPWLAERLPPIFYPEAEAEKAAA